MTMTAEQRAWEAIALIDEINEHATSRAFNGINQPLHAKLCTIRATLMLAFQTETRVEASAVAIAREHYISHEAHPTLYAACYEGALAALTPPTDARRAAIEEAAKVADDEAEYRRQCKAAAIDRKAKDEARDFESMAIACVHVASAIRSLADRGGQ